MKYSTKSSACIFLWILCYKIILLYQISVLRKQEEKNKQTNCRCISCLHSTCTFVVSDTYSFKGFLYIERHKKSINTKLEFGQEHKSKVILKWDAFLLSFDFSADVVLTAVFLNFGLSSFFS